MTGVNTYSTTASENINSITGVTWDEGMNPGLVNNSARQNMADTRSAFNDLVWFQYGDGSKNVAHVYASSTSTTVAGTDHTSVYTTGRRIKAVGSSTGTIYGYIASSSFSAGSNTINYVWDSGSLSNETLTVYLSQLPVTGHPSPSSTSGHLFGLALSNNSGTPNSKIDVAAGSCRDSTDAVEIRPAAITIDCGGTGANGLDAGSLANSTWYHVYAIGGTNATPAGLASTSASAPTMPSGYTYKRRIGSFKTDGSAHIITFIQVGDHFYWNAALFDKSNATPAGSWELVTVTVPTGVKVRPLVGLFGNSTDSVAHYLSLNSGNATPTGNHVILQNTLASNLTSGGTSVSCYYTNTSAQIYFIGSSASMAYSIFTNGWVDDRGKLS